MKKEKIKVFSFNLRIISEKDGINIFHNRKEGIIKEITAHAPHLIGFQEANDLMREYLRDNLKDYTLIGGGRNPDYRDEGTPLAFRKDKFELIGAESFWLSPTPDVPGSRFEDQSSCPRIAVAALLKPCGEGAPFWFINTHLDHKSSSARVLGTTMLCEYIDKKCGKFVLTGDFNAAPWTDEIKILSEKYTNATENIGETFHDFGKTPPENAKQIDYIFTNMDTDSRKAFALRKEPENGIYLSDHHPVCAFVEI